MGSRKRIAGGGGLPDDCWEYVLSKIVNKENLSVDERNNYLETLSLVSKQFLSVSNRFLYSFKLIYNQNLYRPFQRFQNLTSLDLSSFRGDLNALLSRIPASITLTSLNLSNHTTFPVLGLQTLLKKTTTKSTLTSLTCSNMASLCHTHISLIADSFPFLQQLDISFPKTISGNAHAYYNALQLLTQKLSKLRNVNLSGHSYFNDSLFFQLCVNCKFLQQVFMFDCQFLTHDGIASAIYQRPTLNSFSVSNFQEANGFNKITPYFVDSFGTLKGLTCLDFSFSRISDLMLCSLALESLPLNKLVLHGCLDYTYYGIYYLLSRSRFLQHLDLQFATFLNDQGITDLSVYLADLVSINLSGCHQLTNSAFFALLRNCPLLTEIRMESADIGKSLSVDLDLDFVYNQVKSLYLADNPRLKDEDINMFALMFPNMQLLDVHRCNSISQIGIDTVLKRCPNIRHLNLAFCSQANSFSIKHEASKLEVLNLSHTRIDNTTLYVISKIFPCLLQLDLEHCHLVTEKGVRLVVEKCTYLREINLGSCRRVSANVISWMIFSRPSLRKITAPPHFRPRDCDRKLLSGRCLVC
ncbi:F-box/LRR protein, putative [Medicago truncatula]|uniref:F-box/LRR protein, putative n=3 Tax=Medicago truncatula TaxID=3880 RepID=A0A072UYB4_MEDTR|nr:F-box/LRR protein, putative [Medicago truncatula]